MAIYKVVNESTAPEPEDALNETKSEAIGDLKNKTSTDKGNRFSTSIRKSNAKIYAKGKPSNEGYDKLKEKLNKISKPMRTAQDYRDREEFYADSNKLQAEDDERKRKARAFAKRPILGALQRKINRKTDEEYAADGKNWRRDRKSRHGRISGGSYHLDETFDMCADYVVGCLEGSVDEFDLDLFTEASAFIIDCLDEDDE